jgi:hypothetical protein
MLLCCWIACLYLLDSSWRRGLSMAMEMEHGGWHEVLRMDDEEEWTAHYPVFTTDTLF